MPPLKVIVANGQIPMAESSNDRLAGTLVGVLKHFGFRATRLRLPLAPTLEELPQHLAAYRLIDLQSCDGDPGDVLICLDIITACLRHPHKVMWICQPFGGLLPSTLSATESETRSLDLLSSATRHTLERSGRLFLSEAVRRRSTSASAAADVQEMANLGLRTLWPPLFGHLPSFPDPEDYDDRRSNGDDSRPTVLLQGAEAGYLPIARICDVVEACGDQLAFACFPAASGSLSKSSSDLLFQTAADRGLKLIRLTPESPNLAKTEPNGEGSTKLEDLPLCGIWLCALEESSPWSSWNALARKVPLVTTNDSGASVEMVRESKAGTVVEPKIDSIAAALIGLTDELPGSSSGAGTRAKAFLQSSYPTWESVIDDLLRASR